MKVTHTCARAHIIHNHTSIVELSRHVTSATKLYNKSYGKARLALRDRIHLDNHTTPPGTNDLAVGTGGPQ